MQGCSTLWKSDKPFEVFHARQRCTVAVLAESAHAVGLEDVEGEAAQAGEDSRVGADA